jgi:hypothetical protein
MKMSLIAVLIATSFASVMPIAQAQTTESAAKRQVITSSEQLPRRVVKLERLPSQYLEES